MSTAFDAVEECKCNIKRLKWISCCRYPDIANAAEIKPVTSNFTHNHILGEFNKCSILVPTTKLIIKNDSEILRYKFDWLARKTAKSALPVVRGFFDYHMKRSTCTARFVNL